MTIRTLVLLLLFPVLAHAAPEFEIHAGQVVENQTIRLATGSLILRNGATLRNSKVRCLSGHIGPGVIIENAVGVTLENVDIYGPCDAGIVGNNGWGHRLWGVGIYGTRGKAMTLDRVSGSEIFGVYANNVWDGVYLTNHSQGNQIVAVRIKPGRSQIGLFMDGTSTFNQVIRSRAMGNRAAFSSDSPFNRFHHSICPRVLGFAGCWFTQGPAPRTEQGTVDGYLPRWFTACLPVSFQGQSCDYLSPQTALAAMRADDRVVVDTNGQIGWGDLVVDEPGAVVLANTLGALKGRYGYVAYLSSLEVTAPRVRVQNFKVRGEMNLEPDTVVSPAW